MEKIEDREPIVIINQGQKIFGVIHRPSKKTETKSPAVLICHGLGGHKVGKGRVYVQLAETLASMGVTTLRIDFRGSGDSEGSFSAMTIDSEVSDALAALNYLKNDPKVDPEKIALFGRSFGGVIAVLAAQQSVDIKSLALWAPVFGSDQWKEKWDKVHAAPLSPEQRESLLEIEGLRPGYNFFQGLFALKLQDSLNNLQTIPLLHIHGEKDVVVDLSHAEKYKIAREDASANTQFRRLANTDHDFSHFNERLAAIDETAEWFVTTLKR